MKKITIKEILPFLGSKHKIAGNISVDNFYKIKSISEADNESLVWITSKRKDWKNLLDSTKAKLILCDYNINIDEYLNDKCFIIIERPELAILRITKEFFTEKQSIQKDNIHFTAILNTEAIIEPNVIIGPYAVIGKCIIKAESSIGAFTVIHDNVEIGRNVKIFEHCIIGQTGFRFICDEKGNLIDFPHIGKVVIEDDVQIFPYSNIDRGTFGETRVKRGAKIDHYVHVGHNSTVGENAIITAQVVFCGGSSVGKNTVIGVGTLLKDNTNVGQNSMIGLGSVVTKNVPENSVWAGVPARPLEDLNIMHKKLNQLII